MKCDNIIDIDVIVSPYDTGVDIGIDSASAGNYLVVIEFNGTYQRITLALSANADIILPVVNTQAQFMINGDYNHLMQIYTPAGTLFNNTCYSLNCRSVSIAGNGLTPSPLADPYSMVLTLTSAMVSVDGKTITNSLFGGRVINEISGNSQSYLVGTDFSQSGNVITGIDISFFVGQIIKLSW